MESKGAMKFNAGKPRYELIPPELDHGVAQVLTFGAIKYADRNWEKGLEAGELIASCKRHLDAWFAWYIGLEPSKDCPAEELDPESGLSHLKHAGCNIAFLLALAARKLFLPEGSRKRTVAGKKVDQQVISMSTLVCLDDMRVNNYYLLSWIIDGESVQEYYAEYKGKTIHDQLKFVNNRGEKIYLFRSQINEIRPYKESK